MSENISANEKKNNRFKSTGWILIAVCLILIYLVIRFCSYLFSASDSLYEVTAGSTEGRFNSQYTALALRSETVINSQKSGYINFFVSDATPVYVGEQTYVIDENGELSKRLEEASKNQTALNSSDLQKIQDTIYDFDTSFSGNNYYDTYTFKYRMESQILDLINNNVFDDLNDVSSNGSYYIYDSEISGIMQHSIDGFESYTIDDIEASMFRRSNYNKQIIKSNEQVAAGDAVYKVITDDEWYLVFQLDSSTDYEGLDYVTVQFLSDGITVDGDFEIITHSGSKYGVVTLDKYLIRYISDRYIQIEIVSDTVSGLKIPKTAVAEEEFYIIPTEFLTTGGNSSETGFMKQTTASDGSTSVKFTECQVVKQTDEYCYVSLKAFDSGDILVQPDSQATYKIIAKDTLKGAYLSANGSYVFKVVDILGEENSYYIIDMNTSDGLRVYDQILSKASDND